MQEKIRTEKKLISIERNGKIVALYFEEELPELELLKEKYGKDCTFHSLPIDIVSTVEVLTGAEVQRQIEKLRDAQNLPRRKPLER